MAQMWAATIEAGGRLSAGMWFVSRVAASSSWPSAYWAAWARSGLLLIETLLSNIAI
jgi:hypothetical protein